MATANISSAFSITIAGSDLDSAKTFSLDRAFTVIACETTNTAAGAGTLTLSGATAGTFSAQANGTSGAGIVQARSVMGPNAPVGIFAGNASIAANEVVTVTASATTITKVILTCVASGGGQAITIS